MTEWIPCCRKGKKYFFSFVSWRSFFLCFSSLLEKKIIMWNSHVSPSQRAGLELMDMMAVYQEGAYERLCRWSFSRWIKTCNSFNFLLNWCSMFVMLVCYFFKNMFILLECCPKHVVSVFFFKKKRKSRLHFHYRIGIMPLKLYIIISWVSGHFFLPV